MQIFPIQKKNYIIETKNIKVSKDMISSNSINGTSIIQSYPLNYDLSFSGSSKALNEQKIKYLN